MIYCINIEKLSARWPNENHKLNSNGTDKESYLTAFPVTVPNCIIKADIPTFEDIRFLCSQENEIRNNQSDAAALIHYKKLKKKIKNLDKCLISVNYETHMVHKCLTGGIVDDLSFGECSKLESPEEMQMKHNRHITVKEPITDNASMEVLNEGQNDCNKTVTQTTNALSAISLANDKIKLDLNEAEPPGSDTEIYKELLNYYVTYFLYFLETATMRRVFNLPREDCISWKSIKNDLDAGIEITSDKEHNCCASSRTPNAAKVGILFSGGIDSMVLASVADKYVVYTLGYVLCCLFYTCMQC